MESIAIEVSFHGQWAINDKEEWMHEKATMAGTVVPSNCTLQELKEAVYKLIEVDAERYELDMKYFFAYPRPKRVPMKCSTDHDVYVFLKTLNEAPILLKSPLFVDIVPREAQPQAVLRSQIKVSGGATATERFYSSISSNKRPRIQSPTTLDTPLSVVINTPISKLQEADHQPLGLNRNDNVINTPISKLQSNELDGRAADDVGQQENTERYGNVRADNEDNDDVIVGGGCDKNGDIDFNSLEEGFENWNEEGSMHGHTPSQSVGGTSQCDNEVGIESNENPQQTRVVEDTHMRSPIQSMECDSSSGGETIAKHMMFMSKQELKSKLSLYAIKRNFEYKVKKSDTGRFLAGCVIPTCKWKLHASKIGPTECWTIRAYNPGHTCNMSLTHRDHRQASSSIIGEMFKSKFTTSGCKFKPKDLIEDVRKELGANMSYEKAWRAREYARSCVHGTPEESYKKLPLWSAMLESCNQGSVTRIQIDSAGRFEYYFMSIGASIRGFKHMRPVVAIDVTLIKNRYAGVLYIAACKDANEQTYPLAFGIGPMEDYDSYYWFFSRFKEAFGDRSDLVFITSRHASFAPVIQVVYPEAYHGYCTFNLKQDMRTKFPKIEAWKWKHIDKYYDCAVEAYLKKDFELYMAQIQNISNECYAYLMEAHPSKWARSHFPGNRYSVMTSDAVESLHSVLKDARDFPIVRLLDGIRDLMQRWFYERRNDVDARKDCPVAKEINKKLLERKSASASMNVIPADQNEFEVHGGDLIGVVNLRNRTCSCREFTLDGYPCVHVYAVCKSRQISPYTLCDPFYSTDFLRAGYEDTIYPLGDPKQWHAPEEVMSMSVLPPTTILRRPGRRRPSKNPSSTKKCGRCNRVGHNRQTCTFPLLVEYNSTASRRRNPRRGIRNLEAGPSTRV